MTNPRVPVQGSDSLSGGDVRLVYCRRCLKTHAVKAGEQECGGRGSWIYEDTGTRYCDTRQSYPEIKR